MAKSFLGSFFTSAAKAADKAIKLAEQERRKKEKEQERLRIKAEKERFSAQKKLDEQRVTTELINKGYVFVSVKSLNKYNAVIPSDLFEATTSAILEGKAKIPIHKTVLEKMDYDLLEHKAKEKVLFQCAALNNKGIAYEKEGDIKKAIKTYEKNIASRYPAHHSFKRLMILYRKDKKYNDEMRVIDLAIEVFEENAEYQERRTKLLVMIEKQNKNNS